jgi:hypothetical protein
MSPSLRRLLEDHAHIVQAGKGHARGDRLIVDDERPIPLDLAKRFDVFHSATLELAPGDIVRITKGGTTADGEHRLNNGDLRRIKTFDEHGRIVFENGWTLDKEFGHLAHGYVVTSHASQGKTVDVALIGQSSQSFPASSREQFYVSASRARKQVVVYTSDKEALQEAIEQSEERLTATELVAGNRRRVVLRQQQRMPAREPERQKERELVR